MVKASFSNGDTQALGKVVLANFSNPRACASWATATGRRPACRAMPTLGAAGDERLRQADAGAIERSNVDITEELVGLITAQRNFQANAKAIDTASQISQTIINIRT